MQWNEGQKKAIHTCSNDEGKTSYSNLLVNAAAGSGKTAVLVERIIQKILPNESGITQTDIDKLLVVTFTKAAAAEMQQKINKAIVKKMVEVRDDRIKYDKLKNQLKLLSAADISNIDSYCVRLVRNNFHILGVDPNFSPVTNSELELLKDTALSQMFDELYEGDDEFSNEFKRVVAIYSSNNNDDGLAEIIKNIYRFTSSIAEPKKWLDEKLNNFRCDDGIKNSVWIKCIEENIKVTVASIVGDMKKITSSILEDSLGFDGGDIKNYPPLEDNQVNLLWGSAWVSACNDFENVSTLQNKSWDELYTMLEDFKLSTYPTSVDKIKVKIGSKALKDSVVTTNEVLLADIRSIKDRAKSKIDKLKAMIMGTLKENEEVVTKCLYPDISVICKLVKLFIDKLGAVKEKRNVLEFSDIERLAYILFKENEEIRNTYKEKYDEILIDEYQDINDLQEAIFKSISRGDNMFMVGDMKQSIYRFRNADPTIFKHKLDTFNDDKNKVITLNLNYRSRNSVLESVNAVFERIMSLRVGEMEYDENQRLNTGDVDYEDINNNYFGGNKSELCIINTKIDDSLINIEENDGIDESLEEMTKTEKEAQFIANKIQELKNSHFKIRCQGKDGKTEYRDIKNSDIAILSDSVKNIADIYISELKKCNIDCYVENPGYFGRKEVIIMLSLIKIINNPMCDIPLIGVMRSPIFTFTDDELVKIRVTQKGSFINCVEKYNDGKELEKKCKDFLDSLHRWRKYSKYMSSDKLIWTLYEETNIYSYAGTWKDGEEAQSNLRLLFERAKTYENTGFKGLFNFIRYMEKLQNKQDDLSTAKLISDKHDVVKMMTMHKSKGLEFPIVFLCNISKKFRNYSKNGVVIMHKDLGFGMKYINYDERYMLSTVTNQAVIEQNNVEYLSERMRLLYVAMTRAKEKLFVTGTVNGKVTDLEKKWDKLIGSSIALENAEDVEGGDGFLDWVAPIARKNKWWTYNVTEYNNSDALDNEEDEQTEYLMGTVNVSEILDYKYSYERCFELPSKISVTTVKNERQKNIVQDEKITNIIEEKVADSSKRLETVSLPKKPQFLMEKSKITSAQAGTIIHYVMQTIDDRVSSIDRGYISKHIEKLIEMGRLTQKEADVVNIDKILSFYSTELGQRIMKSQKVYKEKAFEIIISPCEVYSDISDVYKNEEIMLQGIIDCYFEEGDGIVLVDYKTDRYEKNEQGIIKIKQKYTHQLLWYARAIEKITGKIVKQKYLYLFSGNDVVQC